MLELQICATTVVVSQQALNILFLKIPHHILSFVSSIRTLLHASVYCKGTRK